MAPLRPVILTVNVPRVVKRAVATVKVDVPAPVTGLRENDPLVATCNAISALAACQRAKR